MIKFKYLSSRPKGYALATVLVLLGASLIGVASLVTISTLESKIAVSQQGGVNAYYAAEAGEYVGLWHLNNTSADNQALANGTLNSSYSSSNGVPIANESFSIHLYTDPAHGAGYGIIDSTGTYVSGAFTATRQILTYVYMGSATSQIGSNALFSGAGVKLTTGQLNLINGGEYTVGNVSIQPGADLNATSQTVSIYNGSLNNLGSFEGTSTTANNAIVMPSFNWNQSGTTISPSAFLNTVKNNGALAGPVTIVTGSVNINGSNYRNKTLTVNGILIIKGSLQINSSGFNLVVNNTSSNQAGVFVEGSILINSGSWDITGLIYTPSTLKINNPSAFNINGGIIVGGSGNGGQPAVQINCGGGLNVTYNAAIASTIFPSNSVQAVQVQHWEESY
jgi:hypothetical protein